jgi:cellulose biosynthesis protein BcsQ
MSIPVIAFFSTQGGVGRTTLVYHLAWTLADLGFRVVAADLDPQASLSAAFLDEERLEELAREEVRMPTIYGAVRPLKTGVGDVETPLLEHVSDTLTLIPGDSGLLQLEDDLFRSWTKCFDGDERSFRVISAFWRVIQRGGQEHGADLIVVDLGPNLGAINRAALIASDFVVIPLGPDLFSIQGLRNLGPALREWRRGWNERLEKNPNPALDLPQGSMQPIGYIVMQHSVRRDRPVKSYDKWIARIPAIYSQFVLDCPEVRQLPIMEDTNCLALLKHYRSLMPMAQEARKPIFHLKPADGALGAHSYAVADARRDFERLAREILARAGIAGRR